MTQCWWPLRRYDTWCGPAVTLLSRPAAPSVRELHSLWGIPISAVPGIGARERACCEGRPCDHALPDCLLWRVSRSVAFRGSYAALPRRIAGSMVRLSL